MTQIPKGVGIIASLHAFSSLFLLVHVLISIPFVIATFFSDAGLGFLATFETFWDWIMVGIHASIAASLIARKSGARIFVIIMASVGLIFAIINILSGNMFAIFSLIMSAVVIGYMKKDHVKAWLNDTTL